MQLDSTPNSHRCYVPIILLGIYAVLPFVILSIYNQPSVDDFVYAIRDNRNSFIASLLYTYNNWSGRYFATEVSRINPIRFQSWFWYKACSLLFIVAFIVVLHALLANIFGKHKLKQRVALTGLCTIVFFSQMPNISRGLYYMSAYLAYQLPCILTLVLLLLLLKFFNATGRTAKIGYQVSIMIICIAIIGSNVLSLISVMTLLSLLLFQLWRRRHMQYKYVLILFLCSLAASLIMILAPGNYVRMGLHPNDSQNFVWSALASIILIPTYFYKWSILLIVVSILYILLWQNVVADGKPHRKFFSVPLQLSLTCFLTTLFLMNFAYTWSVGAVLETKVENVLYFYFVLGWFYNLQVAMERFANQVQLIQQNFVVTAAIMLLFIRMVFNLDNNISTAYLDLLSGKAAQFNDELNTRYAYLRDSECDVCIVKPLSKMPKSLYIFDLTNKPEEKDLLVNNATIQYWGKKKVYLSTPGPSGPPLEMNNLATLHDIGRLIKHKLLGTN
ncbi:DUF6056 family protein [Pontibacter chitinilyticus]|uniref:DUF6056 family protein n=1 Tax=Pontibacter chitinilyticus TaxID=2674989 RepID=UPI00321AC658